MSKQVSGSFVTNDGRLGTIPEDDGAQHPAVDLSGFVPVDVGGGGRFSADSGVASAASNRAESPQFTKGQLSQEDFDGLEEAIRLKNAEGIKLFREVIGRGSFSLDSKIGVEVGIDDEVELYDIYRYLHRRLEPFDGGNLTEESARFLTGCFNAIFESIHSDLYPYINLETGWVSEVYHDFVRNVIGNFNEDSEFYSSVLMAIKGRLDQDAYKNVKSEILENILDAIVQFENYGYAGNQDIFDLFADNDDFVTLLSLAGGDRDVIFDLIIGSNNCEFIRSGFSEENSRVFYDILDEEIGESQERAAEIVFKTAQNDWSLLVELIKEKGGDFIFSLEENGRDLMRFAFDTKNFDLIEALIDKEWDLSKRYENGRNILHFAAETNDARSVQAVFDETILLQVDDDGLNPAYYVLTKYYFDSYWQILALCEERGVSDPVNCGRFVQMAIAKDLDPRAVCDFFTRYKGKLSEADSGNGFLPIFYIEDFVKCYDISQKNESELLLKFLMAGFDFNAKNAEGKTLTESLMGYYLGNIDAIRESGKEDNMIKFIFLTFAKCNNENKLDLMRKFAGGFEFKDFAKMLSDSIVVAVKSSGVGFSRDEFKDLVGFVMKMRDQFIQGAEGIHAIEQPMDGASRIVDIDDRAGSLKVFVGAQNKIAEDVNICSDIIIGLFRDSPYLMTRSNCEGIFEILEGDHIADLRHKDIVDKFDKVFIAHDVIDACASISVGDARYENNRNILCNFYNCLSPDSDLEFATSVISKLVGHGVVPQWDLEGSQFKKVVGLLCDSYDRGAVSFLYSHSKAGIEEVALKIYDNYRGARDILSRANESDLISRIKQARSADFGSNPKRRRIDDAPLISNIPVAVSPRGLEALAALAGNSRARDGR